MKILAFLLICLIGFSRAIGCVGDFDTIEYPSPTNDIEALIDNLLESAERHLVLSEFQLAKDNFGIALKEIREIESQEMRAIRALFGSILANACLEDDEAQSELIELAQILASLNCTNVGSEDENLANGKPILGPDTISLEDCLDMVDNTLNYATNILALAPVGVKWKAGILAGLNASAFKAKQCCRSGGIWKACLQPLFTQWLQLKEWENECRMIGDWYYLPSLD